MMNAVQIETLMVCFYSPNGSGLRDVSAVHEAISFLRKYKLIERTSLACTEKGAAHVKQICNLPLPVAQFIDFNGKEILL